MNGHYHSNALATGTQLVVDLEQMLHNDPAEGRRVLRSLLTSPITVTPRQTADGIVYDYHADARLDAVLAGC